VETTDQIEQQLTNLLRRGSSIHQHTIAGAGTLERSAYGIMCLLADDGPQPLTALAQAFCLDPSTITRQVRALQDQGLAERRTDTGDRRASILDLTERGRTVLATTRARRRYRLNQVLADWREEDLVDFAQLLAQFNASVHRLMANRSPSSSPGSPGSPRASAPADEDVGAA